MIRKIVLVAGIALGVLSAPAHGGAVPGFRLPPGGVRPAPDSFDSLRASHQMTQWKYQRDWNDWDRFTNSYEAALKFAECVNRHDHESDALLLTPTGSPGDRESLVRLARQNRACVAQQGLVAPVLLRAALAEMVIKRQASVRSDAPVAQPLSLGIPETVDGYPIAAISRCQVHSAPRLVAEVLRARPGSTEERDAVRTLYANVPECGSSTPGRLTPTAARLGLVDAAFRRTPPPWN